MTDAIVPPIPLSLQHLPTVGGLVVPWITPRTADGRYLFGVVNHDGYDEVIGPLDKLLRDEAMGTRGPNHAEEKERAEAAYRQFKADTATPLERYGEVLRTSTQLRRQIRPSVRRVPFRPALSPRR